MKTYTSPTVTVSNVIEETMTAKVASIQEQSPFFKPSLGAVGFYL
jgi:hypothetical protein